MVPPESVELVPLKDTANGVTPDVGVAEITAWSVLVAPLGRISKVTLWAGMVRLRLDPDQARSARRTIWFDDVNWYACPAPLPVKFATLTVTGVEPERYLPISMTVSAPSC